MRKLAIILALALAGNGLIETANAAPQTYLSGIDRPLPYSQNGAGPYHMDVLPDGTVTGPIAPNANGG